MVNNTRDVSFVGGSECVGSVDCFRGKVKYKQGDMVMFFMTDFQRE